MSFCKKLLFEEGILENPLASNNEDTEQEEEDIFGLLNNNLKQQVIKLEYLYKADYNIGKGK